MKKAVLGIVMVALFVVAPLAFSHAFVVHAATKKITVAVDLSHGESEKYLGYMQGNITFVNWVNITKGPITYDMLKNIDVFIIGQPTVAFSPDEMDAIAKWLQDGGHILWVAGDSDYGNGYKTQQYVNDLLQYIGAKLRVEYASFYDDIHNAGAFYRVLVQVKPDNVPELNTSIISQGITKPILAHGPAPLIWVDENGKAHDITKETFPGLVRIAWSYNTSYIGDNNPPAPLVYDPLDYGKGAGNFTFVFIAAEYHKDMKDVIVVSGESPYGDYEPTWSPEYHGVKLDGPKFVTNMIKWFQWLELHVLAKAPATTTTTTTTTSPAATSSTTAGQAKGGSNTGLIIGAIIIIIIIIAGAVYFLKK